MQPVLPGLISGGAPDLRGVRIHNIREDLEQVRQVEGVIDAVIMYGFSPTIVWLVVVAVVQHCSSKSRQQRSISRVCIDTRVAQSRVRGQYLVAVIHSASDPRPEERVGEPHQRLRRARCVHRVICQLVQERVGRKHVVVHSIPRDLHRRAVRARQPHRPALRRDGGVARRAAVCIRRSVLEGAAASRRGRNLLLRRQLIGGAVSTGLVLFDGW
jgi:hypothetical protein